MVNTLKIQLYRSSIRKPRKQKAIVKALGFKKLNQIIVKQNNSSIMGMILKVPHLVRIIN